MTLADSAGLRLAFALTVAVLTATTVEIGVLPSNEW